MNKKILVYQKFNNKKNKNKTKNFGGFCRPYKNQLILT